MTTRAAAYIRVSGEFQSEHGTSLASQREELAAYVERMGWSLVGTYEDAGVSGALDIDDRPALSELLSSAKGGAFDVVVVTAWDRLSRSLKNQLEIWERCDRLGISYHSLAEPNSSGEEGQFTRHIIASVSEEERRKIRQRTSKGRRAAVASGKWGGGDRIPFGYEVQDGRLVPHPVDAETVRRMVDLLVDERMSSSEVANILNAEGRLPRWAGRWTSALVRNHSTRSIETWSGCWRYGKSGRGGEIVVNLPEPVLTTDRAAALRVVLATTATKRAANATHPLSNRISCGFCGLDYTGVKRAEHRNRRYICRNAKGNLTGGKETRCKAPTILGAALDRALYAQIRPYLERPELLLREAATAAEDAGSLPAAEATVVAARKMVTDAVTRGIRLGLDDTTIAEMKANLSDDYDAAVRRRDQIAQQMAAAEASSSALTELADLATSMDDLLDDPSDEVLRDVFRALDVRVKILDYGPPLTVEATGRVLFDDLASVAGAAGTYPAKVLSFANRTSR